jgi:hypothetical protein
MESLALVRPGVKWTLWEEKSSGDTMTGGPKRVLSLDSVGHAFRCTANKLISRERQVQMSSVTYTGMP